MPALSLVLIRSAKPEATLAFYRALGCEFVEEKHGSGPVHHACKMGGMIFEIYPGEDGPAVDRKQAGATMLGFAVDDLNATLTSLSNLGATTITPLRDTQWGKRATIADPDGRAVDLSDSWKARAARGNPDDLIRILDLAPDVPPLPGDEMSPENEAFCRAKHGRKN